MPKRAIYLGFDPREAAAFAVAKYSVLRHSTVPAPVFGLVLSRLRDAGHYWRPTSTKGGVLWDDISGAPMSTEFAISRFLVPFLASYSGLAVFMDSDVLVRSNLARLFDQADPTKAVSVVKHDHQPTAARKMDGQVQTAYPRKNWSSVMVFNCAHPANRALTAEYVNATPGRDLHAFAWLKDSEIGELDPAWNWLAGHSDSTLEPKVVHFTDGFPQMAGYEDQPYADEWRAELAKWASR